MYPAPRVDFYRKDEKLYVEAGLPDIYPKEIELHVCHDRLSFSVEKKYKVGTRGGSVMKKPGFVPGVITERSSV